MAGEESRDTRMRRRETRLATAPLRRAERIAIVAGLRTPFAKQASAYRDVSALDLGKIVTSELLARAELDPKEVGLVVFGQVVPSICGAEHRARGGARDRDAEDDRGVQREPRVRDVVPGDDERRRGDARRAALGRHRRRRRQRRATSRSRSRSGSRTRSSRRTRRGPSPRSSARSRSSAPKDFLPVPPALKEPTTGLSMGESAEKMAKEGGIRRDEQDAFAHRSHTRAAKAWETGVFAEEVMHVVPPPKFDAPFTEDNVVRKDSDGRRLRASSSPRSIASTARSRPATRRRSPTAPRRSS